VKTISFRATGLNPGSTPSAVIHYEVTTPRDALEVFGYYLTSDLFGHFKMRMLDEQTLEVEIS
jgi:hypothetical protein